MDYEVNREEEKQELTQTTEEEQVVEQAAKGKKKKKATRSKKTGPEATGPAAEEERETMSGGGQEKETVGAEHEAKRTGSEEEGEEKTDRQEGSRGEHSGDEKATEAGLAGSFPFEPETDTTLVMPDRVQFKVPTEPVVPSWAEEFNPQVTRIRVNDAQARAEIPRDQGVVQQLKGAEVTVGERVARVQPVVRPTQLPSPALKVRNITGEVRNVTAEVIKDKVIVQGIVHKQIFFVGLDNIVRHFSEDVSFSTFIDIPGAEPGMNVQVLPRIEKILFHLTDDGFFVQQKIILEIFVKVTQFVQVGLALGTGPLLLLPRVIGEGVKQELVESLLTLAVPALKVDEIRGEIRDLETEVIPDKVIIQGVIHKQIFFVDLENNARHQAEDVPFSLFLDLPGVSPGVDLQVHPRIEGIFFELLSSTELRQKVVVEVFVKATEAIQERVALGTGPLYKVQQVVGEGQKQILNESVLVLERPALKVREIVGEIRNLVAEVIPDKVIIQGVIHKQIFYIGTDNIEYHQAEDLRFSLFIDVPGALPGLNVTIRPRIETILFNLETETTVRQKVIVFFDAVVTETIQVPLVTGDFALFKLEQVIGEGLRQILVERRERIPVPIVRNVVVEIVVPPAGIVTGQQQIIVENVVKLPQPAVKIKEVQGVITDLRARVILDGAVLVDGIINKQVFFVGEDGIVRSVTEQIPFSILVNVPGITPDTPFTVTVEIENISFTLSPDGRFLRQIIVLNAEVTGETPAPPPFQVVTSVTGPGIVTETVLVRAPIQTPTGVEVREFPVVTEVSGPGIERVEKAVVLLDVVNDGNPNPVPIEVVTDVIFTPLPLLSARA
ncbi:MAG TPA: DUF3794 domain-containing protein [Firmicutes bacterium]|uniref:DUF3794 domain-containing protein n=1 Tax=Capillibacterium thermochitinicola TaxID=2699427 RepID=A0A8J6I0P5_9FIRM|nr:DUF3794 domain-containing protein [Capillibacterium thermochitinicola]MBA2133301.1 DUF3794 domain-containing protein [Capillibacterium thermochitinicola]HHW12461.1 DUF3794 domain-containing protein [Bacillota bacterium]